VQGEVAGSCFGGDHDHSSRRALAQGRARTQLLLPLPQERSGASASRRRPPAGTEHNPTPNAPYTNLIGAREREHEGDIGGKLLTENRVEARHPHSDRILIPHGGQPTAWRMVDYGGSLPLAIYSGERFLRRKRRWSAG
jgi:hypothetical protein